jgi:enoyl-CoA hydratase
VENEDVIVEVDGDALRVAINRPEKRNPLSRAVLARLRQTFEARRDDEHLRLAIVTAAGDRTFAAGGDLKELDSIRTREDALDFSDEAHAALDAIRRFPLPVIAALNGDALGGGAELCVACDIRIMAAHARIGFIQGRLNISTSWGGGADLMRLVGPSRALSLLARGVLVDGAEAIAIGLAEATAPEGDFAAFVETFIAPMRRQTALVMRAFKAQALAARFSRPRDEARQIERDYFGATWVHDDHWAAAARALGPAR